MSLMLAEARAAGDAVAAQRDDTEPRLAELAAELRRRPPAVGLTIARGSSDHAANYFAYLTMMRLGIPVASLPMSLFSLHATPFHGAGQFALALSQSGRSPDIVAAMEALAGAGATTAALVNQPGSPLAAACRWSVPLNAGLEQSVAATKSYIATLAAAATLVAYWSDDPALLSALHGLPARLREACACDWSPAIERLVAAERIMVVGRGLGLAIALEAALKFKETCAIQAEAFSSAEVRHGPMALVDAGYPLLIFAPRGPEQAGLLELAADMRRRGAAVLLAAPDTVAGRDLTVVATDNALLDPIASIQSFYVMAANLAVARGFNPDTPRHLAKVTCTV
jgi:glutamine---fructose-6-phosphate transaminase (isomerizing)